MENGIQKLTALVLLSVVIVTATAQDKEKTGIFLTASDFKQNKLTLETDCGSSKLKIKLNDFLNKPYIEVVQQRQVKRYQKSEIFGFKECNGKEFRFVGTSHFRVVNPTEQILIYKVEIAPIAKTPGKTVWYFSKEASSPVQLLTMHNLKSAFPDNHKFHDELDAVIHDDMNLCAYDEFHKKYRINHLYGDSLMH
jgi:hypothetical protein